MLNNIQNLFTKKIKKNLTNLVNMLYYRCTTNGGNMEYKFYSEEYHEDFLEETADDFEDWLNGTTTRFFICEEQSEYFKYID